MPRIHRIRVTNIQYDYGKKQMPDLLFDTGSLDTLLLLANGGGKTLFIQLLLQTVLPREKLNGRSIADLLQSERYTGHIVVEWLLDRPGDVKHFLCTGFCFTNGRNQNPLESFNYLFEYDELASLHVGTLPLIHEHTDGARRPIGYQQLRDWLKDELGSKLELPETITEYHRRLRTRNILPEEWKNIRDTNGSEGGVDKFFEKSKTTAQLMDNMLIPSVEEMIFQSEAKKKELIHAFAEYRTMLLNIPVIKQNIKDFDAIRSYAEDVVAHVQQYDRHLREWEQKTAEWTRLAKTFHQFEQQAVQEFQQLQTEQEQMESVLHDLRWKLQSVEVFIKQMEFQKEEKLEEAAQREFDRQHQEWTRLLQQTREYEAMYHYGLAQAALLEAAGYRSQLEAMDLSEPELYASLQQAKRVFRSAWEEKRHHLGEQIQAEEQRLKQMEDHLQELKTRKAGLQAEDNQWRTDWAKMEHWLSDYENRKQEVVSLVPPAYVWSPEQGITAYKQEMDGLQDAHDAIEQQLRQVQDEILQTESRLVETSERKNQLAIDQRQLQDQWDRFNQDQEEMTGLLAGQSFFTTDLLADKDKVLGYLREHSQQAGEARVLVQAEVAGLEEKWALLEGKDYYIPQQELVKVKQRLDRSGIHTVLGSEWLAAQPLTQEEKDAYLNHQPLLPYSVLIEEHQVNQVKQLMRQGKDWSADQPILFLVKSGASLRPSLSQEMFFPLFQDELFIYQPESLRIYTSLEAFQQFKGQMQTSIQEKKQLLQLHREQEQQWSYVCHQIERFYKSYRENDVLEWQHKLVQLADQLHLVEQLLNDLRRQKDSRLNEQTQAEQSLKQNEQQQQHVAKTMEQLERFAVWHAEYPGKVQKKREAEIKLEQLDHDRAACDAENEGLLIQRETCRTTLREINQLIKQHEVEYVNYQLEGVEPNLESALSDYNSAKAVVDSLTLQLNEKDRDRKNLVALLEKAEKVAADALDETRQSGLEVDWIKRNYRPLQKEDVRRMQQSERSQQAVLDGARNEYHAAQMRKSAALSVWEDRKQQIESSFSCAPFDGYREETYQDQLRYFQEQQSQGEKEKERISKRISANLEWKRELETAREHSEERLPCKVAQLGEDIQALSWTAWEAYQAKPFPVVRRLEQERETVEKKLNTQKQQVDKQFQAYLLRLAETNNSRVKQFIRDVQVILDDNRLYDFDFVETQFLRIFEGLDFYQQEFYRTLQESETSQKQLTQLCLRRAKAIYDSVMEIPRNSRVALYERDIQLVRIDWRSGDEEEEFAKMDQYLQQVLVDLQRWKQEGMDDDQLDSRMEELLRTRRLMEVIAPMEECRVLVYKPRKESLVRNQRVEYSPWEEVSRWSGGEEYSIYITMFMIMISHIRQQTEGRQNIWKVIVADNPFGKASSPHILETVFQVAKANRIQLICLTAHKQEGILQRFPVVYSLQLRSAYGKEIMKAEQLETGFYRVEATSQHDAQQMTLII